MLHVWVAWRAGGGGTIPSLLFQHMVVVLPRWDAGKRPIWHDDTGLQSTLRARGFSLVATTRWEATFREAKGPGLLGRWVFFRCRVSRHYPSAVHVAKKSPGQEGSRGIGPQVELDEVRSSHRRPSQTLSLASAATALVGNAHIACRMD